MTRQAAPMRVRRLPGVYPPSDDSYALLGALRERARGAEVLEVCAGTGLLALAAARTAASVTAVDRDRRAVASIRINAALSGRRITVRRGDLFAPVAGASFDLIIANPPYMPTPAVRPGPRSVAWDAGWDGRAVLDRISAGVARHLRPGGCLLLVQSAFADADRTATALTESGLDVTAVLERPVPLGPVSDHRIDHLVDLGVCDPTAPIDRLVVLEGRLAASERERAR